ncbi:M20 family metallopeptidase [Pseudoflavonifractor sp. MSJ-37]|uniref:M20 metallopeptidase family protein n=1 Tax=Pseudoflavonifractor sp. MSJ-37 TaxID=2841531 RepID=UPI001C112823|nr:M20 family metallopeptidase [Pseudoflavonifractor sp. MSJ-37]MBU5435633.1 amidohydrolase [Pseudoflavonifractor sp. MSJ-37]
MDDKYALTPQTILTEAQALEDTIQAHRRALHRDPETGPHLPRTTAYVADALRNMGYEPKEICDSGLIAQIRGRDTGRCILLRADMDALQVVEKTDLPFRSENGAMHACGHDMHTAMLLGAAQLLRDHQDRLEGTVKLVFQPDEEGFTGAKAMLAAGVLTDPAPQAALALHVNSGTPSGLVLCGRGTFMAGCTLFRVTVAGVGCHGAMPETGVDPIDIATRIYLALQELVSREVPAKSPAVVTVGRFQSGEAPNIIPQTAVLEGTIRTFDRDLSARLLRRIEELASGIAGAFRGSAAVEELASAPPLRNDPALVDRMGDRAAELFGSKAVFRMDEGGMGSEDFASYTYELPCAYLLLGAGTAQEDPRYGKPMHNERVVFNEDVLPLGAALHTWCALDWLAHP